MKKFIIVIAFTFMLGGCAEQKILENISLTTLVGYELEDEGDLTFIAVIRQVNQDLESRVEIQSATAATSKWARTKIDLKTSKITGSGQLRVALFGENLAKEGLDHNLHILKMSAEISNATYLAIVEGDIKELLEYQYKNITDIGQYIYQLIQQNIEHHHALSSTLHEVNRDKYSLVKSYALPVIKKEEENIVISGMALFKDSKVVGQISADDTMFIMMIRERTHNGTLQLELPESTLDGITENPFDELAVAIDSIDSKPVLRLVDPSVPEFDLTIKMECRLREINTDIIVDDPETIKKLEKEINHKIESEIKQIIKYSQDVNSDIFNFGERFRARVRNVIVDKEKWYELYPQMKVNVKVESQIVRDGVFQ
ncbi:Ger(x)C family spore germination protein [Solibacillus sp. FSL W7-1324]|uniref:Ger(x)C family spore germination protein n=1 Tax=Solibacillus sp. FSL W7-1324 TaxID=2921701 RepID=UPI0030FCBD4D